MKKIVLLNEELGTQMQIYLALCDAYKVEIADSIETVMYLLRKMRPEILLLDYNLGQFQSNGRSGLDFLRKIKKKYNALKVILLLDLEDRQFEDALNDNGADGFLYKPVKNRNLIKHLNKLTELNMKTAS
jgi:DNA-binding response OmpR family regulator